MSDKVTKRHLLRDAAVYVRQSSTQQIRNNRESAERQYGLVSRAKSLGWSKRSVKTIDEDQGRSGTSVLHRNGFKKLLAEIGAGQVGIVLALEASRLARSSADWQRLVEICAITQTLLADESAVYDPRDANDRLLLGLKGTISEAELFTLRCRLHDGRWNKARRGELTRSLPVGYVYSEDGKIIKDPDRQVRSRLSHIFRTFSRVRVARRILLVLLDEGLKIPTKEWGGPRHGTVVWKAPTFPALVRILHNPSYAGAYVYGQFEYDAFDRSEKTGKAKPRLRAPEEWPVCIHGALPKYISWEDYLENQRVLRSNWYRGESRGAPRKGSALLQGIVFCGRCGLKMGIQHYSTKEKRSAAYTCAHAYQNQGKKTCQCMSAKGVDQAVSALFLRAVSPAKVEIALRSLNEIERNRASARKEQELQVQQAEYEVQLAKKRYEAVDPDNRLVAGELEADWERALKNRDALERRFRDLEQAQGDAPEQKDVELVRKLSGDLRGVWNVETTTMEDRKALLRFLVSRVHLDGVTIEGKIRIEVEWHTGATTTTIIDRPQVGVWAPRTPEAVEKRIRDLLPSHSQAQIAQKLNDEGYLSAKGKSFNRETVGYIVRSRGWERTRAKRPTKSRK